MKKSMLSAAACVMLCGCATQQGELVILDLDFRKAPQIEAGVREAEAPYRDWGTVEQPDIKEPVRGEAKALVWWELVLNAVTELESRITAFRLRWGGNHT